MHYTTVRYLLSSKANFLFLAMKVFLTIPSDYSLLLVNWSTFLLTAG